MVVNCGHAWGPRIVEPRAGRKHMWHLLPCLLLSKIYTVNAMKSSTVQTHWSPSIHEISTWPHYLTYSTYQYHVGYYIPDLLSGANHDEPPWIGLEIHGGTSYCNGNPGIRHQILGVHTLKRKSSLQSDIFLRETKVGFILATTNLNLTISMIRLLWLLTVLILTIRFILMIKY